MEKGGGLELGWGGGGGKLAGSAEMCPAALAYLLPSITPTACNEE